jgi:hypothetical protein
MADDVRNEVNGQVSLVGVFSNSLHTKIWPARFPKLCFVVRVLGLDEECDHHLVVTSDKNSTVLGNVSDHMSPIAEGGEQMLFTYVLVGIAFPEPGRYTATFTLSGKGGVLVAVDYGFSFRNPNPEELYLECPTCKAKYGTGLVIKNLDQLSGNKSVCPQCGASNLLDSKSAFRLPNP